MHERFKEAIEFLRELGVRKVKVIYGVDRAERTGYRLSGNYLHNEDRKGVSLGVAEPSLWASVPASFVVGHYRGSSIHLRLDCEPLEVIVRKSLIPEENYNAVKDLAKTRGFKMKLIGKIYLK